MATNEKVAPVEAPGSTPNVAIPTHGQNNTANDIAPVPPSYGQALEERYANEKGNATHQQQPQVPQAPQPAIMVTPITALGRTMARVDCPRCQQAVNTHTVRKAGNQAFIWGAVICLCLGVCLAWIPCVIDDCKDVEHSCSNCHLALANVTASGTVELSPAARQAAQVASANANPNSKPNVNGPQLVQGQGQGQGQAPVMRQEQAAQPQQQPLIQQQETGSAQARVVGTDGQPVAAVKS